MALILFSGCSNGIDEEVFCSSKGYYSTGENSRNYIWETQSYDNMDFYCVDTEKKIVSERYDENGIIVEKKTDCPLVCELSLN